MPLMPVNALDRKLRWSDFVKTPRSPFTMGQKVKVAQTITNIVPGMLSVDPVPQSRPQIFRVGAATITVAFDPSSWVASFVLDNWDADDQAAMLGHEQTHYMLVALTARDLFNDLEALRKRDYTDPADGAADAKLVLADHDSTALQALHDRYDHDTKHDPVRHDVEQAKWDTAVADARKNKKSLRDTLKKAQLIP